MLLIDRKRIFYVENNLLRYVKYLVFAICFS